MDVKLQALAEAVESFAYLANVDIVALSATLDPRLIDGLQNGLALVESHGKVLRQPGGDVGMGSVEPARILVQKDEIIDVADVIPRLELVLAVPVEGVEVDVGEELAAEIADWQAQVCGLIGQALVWGHQFE